MLLWADFILPLFSGKKRLYVRACSQFLNRLKTPQTIWYQCIHSNIIVHRCGSKLSNVIYFNLFQGSSTKKLEGRKAPRSTMSSVVDFYSGKAVLVTGGTGFMGKVLIEKLLRCCPDVKVIYIFVRSKAGLSVQTRVQDITKCKVGKWALWLLIESCRWHTEAHNYPDDGPLCIT